MKNTIIGFLSVVVFTVISCKKDHETVKSDVSAAHGGSSALSDSTNIDTVAPSDAAVFKINAQDIAALKGRTVFTQNGSTLFYFDIDANKGVVRIDGVEYELNRADFNENNYSLSGDGVTIHATNGDFGEMVNDCVAGTFPEVKISHDGKTLKLAQVAVQDCPNY